MIKKLPKIILILIIGGLSYSSYSLRNTIDNTKVVDQFTRFLEKKKQLKENIDNEERTYEFQQDIEEIALSMEDHTKLNDKISNVSYVIDISIILSVLALYFISKEKTDKNVG